MTTGDCYSKRVDDALSFVANAFRDIRRKGTGIPYLSHLCQVMVTVAEHGGDEDQLIAALLHDYLEDIEGATTLEIDARWGPRVTELVVALSDATTRPKPAWRERKEAYLRTLREKSPRVRLISAADKLHNARSILADHRTIGDALWARFSSSREDTHWYYREVVVSLSVGWTHPLLDELDATVRALHLQTGIDYSRSNTSQ